MIGKSIGIAAVLSLPQANAFFSLMSAPEEPKIFDYQLKEHADGSVHLFAPKTHGGRNLMRLGAHRVRPLQAASSGFFNQDNAKVFHVHGGEFVDGKMEVANDFQIQSGQLTVKAMTEQGGELSMVGIDANGKVHKGAGYQMTIGTDGGLKTCSACSRDLAKAISSDGKLVATEKQIKELDTALKAVSGDTAVSSALYSELVRADSVENSIDVAY